jgi:hypothetical protein
LLANTAVLARMSGVLNSLLPNETPNPLVELEVAGRPPYRIGARHTLQVTDRQADRQTLLPTDQQRTRPCACCTPMSMRSCCGRMASLCVGVCLRMCLCTCLAACPPRTLMVAPCRLGRCTQHRFTRTGPDFAGAEFEKLPSDAALRVRVYDGRTTFFKGRHDVEREARLRPYQLLGEAVISLSHVQVNLGAEMWTDLQTDRQTDRRKLPRHT